MGGGRCNPSAAPASGLPPRRPVKLYGLHRRRSRRIGWSVIGVFIAVGIAAAIRGNPTAFFVFLLLTLAPWLITFNSTRPTMHTSERGLIVIDFPQRQVIPWDQVERVALMQNGHPRVVVHAYAGSVIIDRVIDDHSAQKRFTDFIRSIDQLHQSRQMASPSAAETSVNRGTRPGDSGRPNKADLRAQARMRSELHRGTGVQLDGAGTAATTYWAPDPTGAHDLRLIRIGRWTPMVVTAGVPGSDPALRGSASFEWIGPPPRQPERRRANGLPPAPTWSARSGRSDPWCRFLPGIQPCGRTTARST